MAALVVGAGIVAIGVVDHTVTVSTMRGVSALQAARDFANVRALDYEGNQLPWLRRDEIAQVGVHLRLPVYTSDGGLTRIATTPACTS